MTMAADRSNSARQAASCDPSAANQSSTVITPSTVICVERMRVAMGAGRTRPGRAAHLGRRYALGGGRGLGSGGPSR